MWSKTADIGNLFALKRLLPNRRLKCNRKPRTSSRVKSRWKNIQEALVSFTKYFYDDDSWYRRLKGCSRAAREAKTRREPSIIDRITIWIQCVRFGRMDPTIHLPESRFWKMLHDSDFIFWLSLEALLNLSIGLSLPKRHSGIVKCSSIKDWKFLRETWKLRNEEEEIDIIAWSGLIDC